MPIRSAPIYRNFQSSKQRAGNAPTWRTQNKRCPHADREQRQTRETGWEQISTFAHFPGMSGSGKYVLYLTNLTAARFRRRAAAVGDVA